MLSALYVLNGLPKKILAAFWNVQESIQPALTNCQTNEPANQQPQNILQDFVRLLELSLLLFHYRGRSNHIILQAKRCNFGLFFFVTLLYIIICEGCDPAEEYLHRCITQSLHQTQRVPSE